MMPSHPKPISPTVSGVLRDLAASPTPYHATARAAELLKGAGYSAVDPTADPSSLRAGSLNYTINGGALMAWRQPDTAKGYLIVGAHTDSPNLRVRTKPDVAAVGFSQIGMEVYGGVLLNSWLDRDLSLAGRVMVAEKDGAISERLYQEPRPILRLPQLAIHLDRAIRDNGLKVDPQQHTAPLWALGDTTDGNLRSFVADSLGVEPEAILSWDLMTFDTQAPAIIGRDGDMFASGRIDNLVSTFCAVRALIEVTSSAKHTSLTPVVVLYDHEEIGSTTATGAAGPMLENGLERISAGAGADRFGHLAALTKSLVLSVDGAHATHPNYVDRHEPSHRIGINDGVVIKRNANQRYATEAPAEAIVVAACRAENIKLQYYIHRNDLPCGSTIGPITAARLGTPTVDMGIAQLAMHSAREMAGVYDLDYLCDALRACWMHSDTR